MKKARELLYLGGYNLSPMVARRYYMGGDPPQQATSTTTVQQQYSPEEAAQRAELMNRAKGIYESQKDTFSSMINPSAKPVAASANTLQGQEMVKSAAMGQGQTAATNAGHALNFGLSGDVLNPGSNPALQESINSVTRRVGNTYTDPGGVMSKIRGNFTAGNSGGSGTREGIAAGIAGREYLNTIGDVSASMTSDAYNKGLDYMKSSMAFAPNAYNLMMQPGATVGAVGSQQEAYAQSQENARAGDRAWNISAPWAGLQPYANMVLGMSNPSMVTNATAPITGGGGNPMLGGAMMGMQMGSMFGSPLIGAGAGALLGLLS